MAADPGSQATRQVLRVVENSMSAEEEVNDEKGMQRECATRVPRVATMVGIWNVVSASQNARGRTYSQQLSHSGAGRQSWSKRGASVNAQTLGSCD